MNEELQNALVSRNAFLVGCYASKSGDDMVDDEFLAAELHKNKWSLPDVIEIGNSDLTKLFIDNNISMDVDRQDSSSRDWTALHTAVYNFDEDHVKLLLDYNADPNKYDGNSKTPLFYLYGDLEPHSDHDAALEITKMMINRGAEAVTVKDNENILQIENILGAGDENVIGITLSMMDIDMRARYEGGNTVAHYLARNGNSGFSTMMRDRDFDVNARNDDQETPLFCAVEISYTEAVEFLLSRGADVNAANRSNCTPLHAATASYNLSVMWDKAYLECVMILLEHSADIQLQSIKNGLPHTVFDLIVEKHKDDKLCKIILQHLALQETTGATITSLIQSKINSNDGIKEYFSYYKLLLATEVVLAKTLFMLLTCSQEKLIPYMRNEEMKVILFSCSDEIKSTVVYYHRLLQKRLLEAEKVTKLRNSAAVVIGKLINIDHDCHPLEIDAIMRYLGCRDLITLLSV